MAVCSPKLEYGYLYGGIKKGPYTKKPTLRVRQVGCILTCMLRLGVPTGVDSLCSKKKKKKKHGCLKNSV